jgi:hypothetical protein
VEVVAMTDWAEAAEACRELAAELLPWLRRTIADAEQVARDAAMRKGPVWEVCPRPPYRWGQDEKDTEILGVGKPIITCDYEYGGLLLAEHIVRHDPQAVLAQCAAHTAILDAVERYLIGHPGPCTNEGVEHDASCDLHTEWNKTALKPYAAQLVGLAYQHCPDYRQEWRP